MAVTLSCHPSCHNCGSGVTILTHGIRVTPVTYSDISVTAEWVGGADDGVSVGDRSLGIETYIYMPATRGK